MHFYRKQLNLDKVERITWYLEFEGQALETRNIAACTLFFDSGHEHKLWREDARNLFNYLSEAEGSSSPAGIEYFQQDRDYWSRRALQAETELWQLKEGSSSPAKEDL